MSIFDPWSISAGTFKKYSLDEMIDRGSEGLTNYIFVVATHDDEAILAAYGLIQGKKINILVSPEESKKLPSMKVKRGSFVFYLTQTEPVKRPDPKWIL